MIFLSFYKKEFLTVNILEVIYICNDNKTQGRIGQTQQIKWINF